MPFRPIIGCVVVGEAVTSDFNPVRPEGGGRAGVVGVGGGGGGGAGRGKVPALVSTIENVLAI